MLVIPSVKEAINVNQFLNPSEEDVTDKLEDLYNIVTCLFIFRHVISYLRVVISSKITCTFTYFAEGNTSL